MNLTNKLIAGILLPLVISSCAFYPKVADNQNEKCELVTKKLTIETATLDGNFSGLGGNPRDLIVILAGATVVATASAIVTGSILLTCNTIHWIEQEGRCEDGVIKKAIADLADSLSSLGVWFADSTKDILDWISLNKDKKKDKTNQKDVD